MSRYKNHYFLLLSPSRNEPEYIVWLMELGAMRNNSDWAETSSPEKIRVTRPQTPKTKMNRWKNTLYKTFCRLQQVYKKMQDIITSEFHFRIFHVQIWTSVAVDEDWKLEKIELCIVALDSAKCIVVWTWTKYFNWTRNSHSNSACTNFPMWTE